MIRLLKIRAVKMWQKTAVIIIPLLCMIGIVLLLVIKVSPASIHTIVDLKKILINDHKTPAPRDQDQLRRKEFIDKQCANTSYGSAINILISKTNKISYCVVPKAESKFWLSAFGYISKERANQYDFDPAVIRLSHDVQSTQFSFFNLQTEKDEMVVEDTRRILFTKNPYARLWMIYVENVFLPDLWNTVGLAVASRRKEQKPLSLKCGHDVTFLEFLDHVSLDGQHPSKMKKIWRPVQHLCNPCIYQPDFVGKVELFEVDANHILRQFHFANLINDYRSARYEIEEITFLIDHYYAMFEQGIINDCISKSGLAMRLWTSFQVKGYLPLKTETALKHMTENIFDINMFREVVINVYNQYRKNKYVWYNQRNKLLIGAYKEIPFRILKNLTTIYAFDFKAFGYEMFPKQFLKM